MFPFLGVEPINKKSASHTHNSTKNSHDSFENFTEESQGFAQIFNALMQPAIKKNSTKKDSIAKTHPNTIKDDRLIINKQPSNFLKILDEKYNLIKNFKDQKTTDLTSARDLLEFSKSKKQNKTLQDLNEVAKNLQLGLKKISLESTIKNTELKNTMESNIQSQFFMESKIKPQQRKRESFIFDTILQDKSLSTNSSLKAKNSKEYKKDKDIKDNSAALSSATKDTKEQISKLDSQILKKESKAELQDTKIDSLKANKKHSDVIDIQDEKKVESKNNSKLDSQKAEIKTKSRINQNIIKSETHENLDSQILKKESKAELQDTKIDSLKANLELESKIKMESKIGSKSRSKLNTTQIESNTKDNKEVKNNKQKEVRQGSLNAISEEFSSKNNKDIKQNQINTFNAVQKEEIIQQIPEQTNKQENFLDNLLKTNQKIQNDAKELIQQPQKEKEIRKESEKLNQESYQQNLQTQRELRFNPQNTFTHFSDRLRDAITNYRPPVTKISLELNPQNLGSVELTIAKNGDKLSVQISSNQNALQLIMQNTQEFKNALGNLGFQNIEIDFKDNQGNSLGDSNTNNSNGNQQESRNSSQQEQQNSQNFEQNAQQNHQNGENWNENSLHIDKKAKNPYEKLTTVELSFSYYA